MRWDMMGAPVEVGVLKFETVDREGAENGGSLKILGQVRK